MLSRDNPETKTLKTLIVFGCANLLLTPLTLIDSNYWLISSVLVNAFLLRELHSLGKSRRPGSNLLSNTNNFFSSHITGNSSQTENAFRNVINGGAAVHDEVAAKLVR